MRFSTRTSWTKIQTANFNTSKMLRLKTSVPFCYNKTQCFPIHTFTKKCANNWWKYLQEITAYHHMLSTVRMTSLPIQRQELLQKPDVLWKLSIFIFNNGQFSLTVHGYFNQKEVYPIYTKTQHKNKSQQQYTLMTAVDNIDLSLWLPCNYHHTVFFFSIGTGQHDEETGSLKINEASCEISIVTGVNSTPVRWLSSKWSLILKVEKCITLYCSFCPCHRPIKKHKKEMNSWINENSLQVISVYIACPLPDTFEAYPHTSANNGFQWLSYHG